MKWLGIALLVGGLAWVGFAQPPAFELEDETEQTSEIPDLAEQVEPPPSPSPDSLVFRWLQRLRERNPALHARLEELYRENPPAFHLRVRRLMEQERIRLVLQRYPTVFEAVSQLSPEERANFYRDMAFPGLPPPRRHPPHRSPAHGRHPSDFPPMGPERSLLKPMREHAEAFRKMAEIRIRYQKASTAEEKAAARAEARAALEEILSQRKARLMKQIERIQTELSLVRGELDTSGAEQAEILEQQLSAWLESTNGPAFHAMPVPSEQR